MKFLFCLLIGLSSLSALTPSQAQAKCSGLTKYCKLIIENVGGCRSKCKVRNYTIRLFVVNAQGETVVEDDIHYSNSNRSSLNEMRAVLDSKTCK